MIPHPSPVSTNAFHARAAELELNASCELLTAHSLGTMTTSKPGGQVLKLGKGIGLGSAYLASVVRIWTGQVVCVKLELGA
ncbi:hypothetical protein [Deinococcus marmoris]|uniref:Uncharacterized protein n=1 Tax=Deinococcus marmoris TaxID=249408 RepID=A0A1U7NYX2_9DEIO|nr:hypothetical protein [Deinococcus marmoris]OLV18121.1 hypothetical protein BOO71_0007423 [Deinococcus marmoris]